MLFARPSADKAGQRNIPVAFRFLSVPPTLGFWLLWCGLFALEDGGIFHPFHSFNLSSDIIVALLLLFWLIHVTSLPCWTKGDACRQVGDDAGIVYSCSFCAAAVVLTRVQQLRLHTCAKGTHAAAPVGGLCCIRGAVSSCRCANTSCKASAGVSNLPPGNCLTACQRSTLLGTGYILIRVKNLFLQLFSRTKCTYC